MAWATPCVITMLRGNTERDKKDALELEPYRYSVWRHRILLIVLYVRGKAIVSLRWVVRVAQLKGDAVCVTLPTCESCMSVKKNKNQVISVKWWKIYVDNKFSFGTPKVRVQVAVQFIKW
jgi:hypothetical protein